MRSSFVSAREQKSMWPVFVFSLSAVEKRLQKEAEAAAAEKCSVWVTTIVSHFSLTSGKKRFEFFEFFVRMTKFAVCATLCFVVEAFSPVLLLADASEILLGPQAVEEADERWFKTVCYIYRLHVMYEEAAAVLAVLSVAGARLV